MGLDSISVVSWFCITLIVVLSFYIIAKNWFSKNRTYLWQPINFIAAFFLYYVIVGPLVNIYIDNGAFYAHLNVFQDLDYGYIGAALSMASICISYYLTGMKRLRITNSKPDNNIFKVGMYISLIGLFFYCISGGYGISNLVSLGARGARTGDIMIENASLSAYLSQGLNLSLGGLCLMLCALLKNEKKTKKWMFFLLLYGTLSLMLSSGFRYRLVISAFSLSTVWYICKNARPKLSIIIPFFVCFLLLMGIMEKGRAYGYGINYDVVSSTSSPELISSGMNDTRTFFAGCAYMSAHTNQLDYVYFEPIVTAIVRPIPRTIWKNKPIHSYLLKAQQAVFNDSCMGVAVPSYVEHFMAFSWFGIIIFGGALGVLSRLIWNRFSPDSINSILLLALYNGWTYIFLSRGYLPQSFESLVLIVFLPYLISSKMLPESRILSR